MGSCRCGNCGGGLEGCCSSGNGKEGYMALGGAHMTVNSSPSDGDGAGGCAVRAGGGSCWCLQDL